MLMTKYYHAPFQAILVCMVLVGVMLGTPSLSHAEDTLPLPENERQFSYDQVYKVHIHEATWGLNCDGRKVHRKAYKKSLAAMRHEIHLNNVLEPIKEICDGKDTCSFKIDVETLKSDPAEGCKKILEVYYRCFSYDVPKLIQERQGKTVEISCIASPDEQEE